MQQLHSPLDPERAAFHERFARSFADPRFDGLREAVQALEELAWRQYCAQQGAAPLQAPAASSSSRAASRSPI